ncbi:hypothetical protein VHUM_02397 [Vanrija humicola]|uniref:Enoyl-CoA hydratase n=1 Tax=Vanrija humicola TaxID=5417 RepID=A0A7D8Z348_VANHU|nr:hypothetical protein VHUM_02397 [Vanrija humicola]
MTRPTLARTLRTAHARRAFSIGAAPHARLEPASALAGKAHADLDLYGVNVLVLDRPAARNALSVQMVHEMREALDRIAADQDARIAIVHSTSGVFCAGADLRERKGMSPSEVEAFLNNLNDMVSDLEALGIPTIAAVPGPALGGGTELALGADLRTGEAKTAFVLPETKLGIIPGAGGTQRLTKLVGVAKSLELIYTGRRVEVAEAERLGLLNAVAKDGATAFDAALDLSTQILTSAPLSLRAAKRAIKAAPYLDIKDGLKYERAAYEPLLSSEDRNEGLRAFAEKRKPQFQGR